MENGEWSLEGRWVIRNEYVAPAGDGTLRIAFDARDVYLVIDPGEAGGIIEILVDGEPADDTTDVAGGILEPSVSRLYHLVSLDGAEKATLTLNVSGDVKLYAFTFG